MFIRFFVAFFLFFGSKQSNFVPLYHTQVMTDSRAYSFETM